MAAAAGARKPSLQSRLALAGRRFHAWWEGYEFDEDVELAAMRARLSSVGAQGGAAIDDIVAELIWGTGRLGPGSPAWTMRLSRALALRNRSRVFVFGAGAGAALRDLKDGAGHKATGFTHLTNVAGANLETYDIAFAQTRKTRAAGALSFFELTRDPTPSSFAQFAAEALAPAARAIFVEFATARKGPILRGAFPTARHGAPKQETEYADVLRRSGFSIERVDDETAYYASLIEAGWVGWRRVYEPICAVRDAALRASMAAAFGEQARLWAERYEAMRSGRLRVLAYCIIRD